MAAYPPCGHSSSEYERADLTRINDALMPADSINKSLEESWHVQTALWSKFRFVRLAKMNKKRLRMMELLPN